jgi:hypothetical protein
MGVHVLQTGVSAVAVTPDGSYAVSAAAGDPTAAVFSLALKAASKQRTRKAKGHIQMDHAPVSLACFPLDATANDCSRQFLVLAVTEAATVEVWHCKKGEKSVSATRRCLMQLLSRDGDSSRRSDGVLAACFRSPTGATQRDSTRCAGNVARRKDHGQVVGWSICQRFGGLPPRAVSFCAKWDA